MNKTRESIRSSQPIQINGWNLWVIDIFHTTIQFDAGAKAKVIESVVPIIETKHLSDEFNYLKTGFVFFHSGRRGTTISVWHWAEWSGTFEVFNSAWYCYDHDVDKLESLDEKEPILCNLDLEIIFAELLRFKVVCDQSENIDDVVERYLNKA